MRRLVGLLSLFSLAAVTPAATAQVDLTVTPAMTKGPERALVTIVEFSDYE